MSRAKPIPRISKEDLRDFVLGVCDGSIFVSAQIHEGELKRLLPLVFMPLAFGALDKLRKKDVANIGVVWERMSQAGYRGINGYPMFMSCHLMHKDDWEAAKKAITREQKRREKIAV